MKDKIRIGIQNDLKLNLSRNSFRHLSRLNMSYFDEKNDAEILNNLRMDIENICMVADNSLFFVFAQIFSIIGGMVGLFILNAKLAGLVVLLIPIKYLMQGTLQAEQENHAAIYYVRRSVLEMVR